MSISASGSLGKTVTFSSWKGRAYARQLVTPSNPKSAGQMSVRAMMKFLAQSWAALTTGNKATWLLIAADSSISPFNAYVAYSLNRWTHFKGPTKEYPAADASTPAAAPTTTVTAAVRELSLSIADGAPVSTWGFVIHRSTVTGFTPSRATGVICQIKTATPTVIIDTPLLTGIPYYYRVGGLMADGVLGVLEAQKTGTPL
jgi:hypothetical protein